MKPLPKPQDCDSISKIRDALDVIDGEILKLLGQRQDFVKEIVKFKSSDEEGIIARERKELVLKQRQEWAEEYGLDEELIEKIFRLLIDKNIQIQLEISRNINK